ncbi:MAG: TIR domain-containing protein [Pseudomonadota bacterium]
MREIFVSYAREDTDWVEDLVGLLERQGWRVFWDRKIPAGTTWREHIGAALEEAKCVIVVWSPSSITSHYVLEEADVARQAGKLLPVKRSEVDLPMGFTQLHAADLTRWNLQDSSPDARQLFSDVARYAGEPEPTKGPPRSPQPADASAFSNKRFRFAPASLATYIALAVVLGLAASVSLYLYFSPSTRPAASGGPDSPVTERFTRGALEINPRYVKIGFREWKGSKPRKIKRVIVRDTQVLDLDVEFRLLEKHKVSYHYIVDLDGSVWALVREADVAYHSGSHYNGTSVGIGVMHVQKASYPKHQINGLRRLVTDLAKRYNLDRSHVVSAADISPKPSDFAKIRDRVLADVP